MSKPLPAGFLKNPIHLLAFGFGSGCAPKAPGTFGTLAGLLIYLLLQKLDLTLYLLVIFVASLAGIYICDRASKALKVHDHGGIVWDEFVGYWITMIAAPAGWFWILLGFAWFRLFDIVKPWPINIVDKQVGGGLGIMLDDILAGLMGFAALQWSVWLYQFVQ